MRLHEKAAFITGGRQGIGRAIVEAFLEQGADVMTCGRGERPGSARRGRMGSGRNVVHAEEVDELGFLIQDRFGGLDILVNNAGIQIEKTVLDTTDEDWEDVIGVNAKGVF